MTARKAPTAFDLRVFAVLLAPFCGLVGAWIGRLLDVARLGWWLGLAILPVGILGCLRPTAIQGVYNVWTAVTAPLGRGLSLLLLSLIYYAVFSPIGWCLRLFGHDPAQRRWRSDATTYWVDRSPLKDDGFFRPF